MARRKQDDLQKVTFNLVKGDRDTLDQHFPSVGWSVAARRIINKACRKLREKSNVKAEAHDDIELTLDD